jgi:hypothetical protein
LLGLPLSILNLSSVGRIARMLEAMGWSREAVAQAEALMLEQGALAVLGAELASVLVFPFLVLFWAAVVHVCGLLFGCHQAGYGGTVRAISYALAPLVFTFVPYVGFLVGAGWATVLSVKAMSSVHEASDGRATLTVFGPALFWCCCCGLTVAMMIAGMTAGMTGGGQ